MPTYEYQARNKEGKKIHGQRVAQSSSLLGIQLLKEGITPVNIRMLDEKTDQFSTLKRWFGTRPVTPDEMAMVARQMHALLKTGVPVSVALRQLAENARHPQLSKVMNGLVEKIEAGRTLATAMQDYSTYFNPVVISMIRVGEASGELDKAFMRLNTYLELENVARKKAASTLRYPAFVLVAMTLAFFVVTGWVIPSFARVFTGANLTLPALTRYMMAFSAFCGHYGFLLFVLLCLSVGGIIYYLHTPNGQYRWGKLQLSLPVAGKILRKIVLLRFAQAFSIISDSGVSLIEGIELSAETTGNAYARSEILSLRQSIERGLSLPSAIAASPLFTSLEIQMLGISEKTGQLAIMLEQIAAYYRDEVEYDLKKLNDVMEPLIMLGLAILVGILAFSVYLPIWNLVKIVHSQG